MATEHIPECLDCHSIPHPDDPVRYVDLCRLHNSAPELLRVCKRIYASLKWEEDRSGTTYTGYDSLREAIENAEGAK